MIQIAAVLMLLLSGMTFSGATAQTKKTHFPSPSPTQPVKART